MDRRNADNTLLNWYDSLINEHHAQLVSYTEASYWLISPVKNDTILHKIPQWQSKKLTKLKLIGPGKIGMLFYEYLAGTKPLLLSEPMLEYC